jgi:cholesterol oxidase
MIFLRCISQILIGDATDLYEAVVSKDITVIKGCGLGGTSLINANVALVPNERVFDNSIWPQEIQNDMTNLMTEDLNHVHQMLRPTEYPDDFPKLKKMEAMQKAAKCLKVGDIEDAGNIFKKTPLYV